MTSAILIAALSLNDIFAPQVVGVPPNYAHRDLCQLPDGEIRHYGWQLSNGEKRFVYTASRDDGLSWRTFPAATNDVGAMVRSPWSGDWITILNDAGFRSTVVRSKTFPAEPNCPRVMLDAVGFAFCRQPQPLRERGHWICAGQRFPVTDADRDSGFECPGVLLSRDDGYTWKLVVISNVVTQAAEPLAPDAVPRWENYCCEPTVCQLKNGDLLMIVRTTTDHDWCYRSTDGGETWSGPEKMPYFYASNTMPTLFRLKDGRLLFFWNNTVPLPKTGPVTGLPFSDSEVRGRWETVFTNRDVLHAAISEDDGRTWVGFREILMNERRNDADFRQLGNDGIQENDKSVHQSQAVELPGGKVLLSAGQNVASRRFVAFDPNWLYETSREEDFRRGLGNVCDHLYVKGAMGGARGWAGHCAWNRVHGARMVVDPDLPENQREVVHLARRMDVGLVSDLPGLVWNFPAARTGRLAAEVRLPAGGQGARLVLSDHWFNPCDRHASEHAPARLELKADAVTSDRWVTVEAQWDADKVVFTADGVRLAERTLADFPRFGFSYLHIQLLAEGEDLGGIYLRSLRMSGKGR